MMERKEAGEELVFGLDIGTRNVVGTVGYRIGKEFVVLAQYSKEHETRAMIDGQIHDIGRVGAIIREVKENLEEQIGRKLTSVCIAAAGRVLKTITTNIEYTFDAETLVTAEDIHTMDLLGIEKAQKELAEQNDTKYKFYCVGYSVVRYYLNGELFFNLESHKADKIGEDIIVTFLPEDVIDGLYSAVALAELTVANMTLEPIAAIDVAIPENYRMLNIALVDVGAGTSDISITKEGSIIAYGMIPQAGDEISDLIVQKYLVDFHMAEHIKLESTKGGDIEYTDIMGLNYTISSEEIWDLVEETVDKIATDVAEKIKELNGDKSVSATFVVGGGGKIHGFTEKLAEKLGLPKERVALRGEEVLQTVTFEQPDIKKDPLLVTPIGICLNYYDQKNRFIMVHFNGQHIKLYDNNKLTVVDAAIQAGFPNESLFPKRGKEINYTVNGNPKIARGEAGESAVIKVNDKITSINAPLVPNSVITVEPSTMGAPAKVTIADIADFTKEDVNFVVNGKNIHCPKFVEVNGNIELSSYEIKEGDVIETRSFYTIEQLAEFMDVTIDTDHAIMVNNRSADLSTLVYENFTIEWVAEAASADISKEEETVGTENDIDAEETSGTEIVETENDTNAENVEDSTDMPTVESITSVPLEASKPEKAEPAQVVVPIIVNGIPMQLTGKMNYIFVDIFDIIDFDLSKARGRGIVTRVNGKNAEYMQPVNSGDVVEIYWEEN
ncbi:MAG: rod shape-determining protein [Lachnospiraceae bacterium]|nr:rod shape-determining protein [Lachnospiraceae bacterium]